MTNQLRDAMLTGAVLEAREYLLREIETQAPWNGAIQVRDSYNEVWYTVTGVQKDGIMTVVYEGKEEPEEVIADRMSFDQIYQIAIGL